MKRIVQNVPGDVIVSYYSPLVGDQVGKGSTEEIADLEARNALFQSLQALRLKAWTEYETIDFEMANLFPEKKL